MKLVREETKTGAPWLWIVALSTTLAMILFAAFAAHAQAVVSKVVCDRQYTDASGAAKTGTACRLSFKLPEHTDRVCATRDADGSVIQCKDGAAGDTLELVIPYPPNETDLRASVTAMRTKPEPGVVYAGNATPIQSTASTPVLVPSQTPAQFIQGIIDLLQALGNLGSGS